MAAPATHESKPGSTARDAAGGAGPQGTARDRSPGGCRARANRLRRLRARTMAPHNPTTGLFQGDGGRCRAGAEDFMTEEVLIEGGDAGVDGVDPARPFSRPSMASERRDKRVNRATPAPCVPRRPPRAARPQQREMPPRASVHTQSCSDAGKRTEKLDFPGYWTMPAPKKRRHRQS